VRSSRLWANLPGCENTVIEDVDWHEEDGRDAGGPALRLNRHGGTAPVRMTHDVVAPGDPSDLESSFL
jgi:hypothetical protein